MLTLHIIDDIYKFVNDSKYVNKYSRIARNIKDRVDMFTYKARPYRILHIKMDSIFIALL